MGDLLSVNTSRKGLYSYELKFDCSRLRRLKTLVQQAVFLNLT